MLPSVERDMSMRLSDYRFWLLFTTLAMALLVACSSDNTGGTPGNPGTDGATESAADSMTAG
jgi:hypothetical protein